MSVDNEITKEQNSIDRIAVFKKRTTDFFADYENPNGSEDALEICLIRDGRRAVSQAEEIINRQKAENERLQKENEILSTNADNAFQEGLNESRELFKQEVEAAIRAEAKKEVAEELIYKIVNTPTKFESTYYMYRDGIAFRQNEIIDIIKEMAGADNAG